MFKGILLTKSTDQFNANLADIDEKDLPDNDVTVLVEYSTINYKDALAITDKSPIVRKWPRPCKKRKSAGESSKAINGCVRSHQTAYIELIFGHRSNEYF